jgi:hypothetical protein
MHLHKSAMQPKPNQANDNAVLTKALFAAAEDLGLSQAELGGIIGYDRSTLSRRRRAGGIEVASKQGELSLLLIRVYRALYAIMGGNKSHMRHWLSTENLHLQAVPKAMLAKVQGLAAVLEYLDAMRGRL